MPLASSQRPRPIDGTRRVATVLVVVADAVTRDLLGRRLEPHGYRVRLAADGTEALHALAHEPCDLVLLSAELPGMSGLDVLASIRRSPALRDLPVVMIAARNDSGDIVDALDLGADDYVTLPLHFPVALARVRAQLARARPRRRAAGIDDVATTDAPSVRTSGTALLVEDDHEVRLFVRDVLEGEGYVVVDAPRGDVALEVASRMPAFDLLVTDLAMPGMGGLALSTALHQVQPDLPVVFMSGHDARSVACQGHTALPVLQKPFRIEAFLSAVRRARHARHTERATGDTLIDPAATHG